MKFSAIALSAISLFFSVPTWAATLTLSGGTLTHPAPASNWQYSQNGFVVDVQGQSNHPSVLLTPPDLSVISSNGGYGNNPTVGITVSHAQGKVFGLKSMDISQVYSGVEMSVYRNFQNGMNDYQIIPTFYNALKISAVKSDGSSVTRTMSPWCADTGISAIPLQGTAVFGAFASCSQDRDTIFNWKDFGSDFNSILSFSVDVLNPFEAFASVSESGNDPQALHASLKNSILCSPLNAPRFDPYFDIDAICHGTTLLNPALGSWSFGAGTLGGARNDAAYISISSMSLAPIPLPASLPLLAAGIALLAFIPRGRRWTRLAT